MKRLMFLLLMVFMVNGAYAKLMELSLNLSPNSEGQLEGAAGLDVNWWKYLSSGVDYNSTSFSIFSQNTSNVYNMDNYEQTYILYFLQLEDKFIKDLLNIDWLGFTLGLVGKRSIIEKYENGMVAESTNIIFFQDYTQTKFFKPMVGAGLSFNFGMLELNSYLLVTPFQVSETYSGYFANSVNNNLVTYTGGDNGREMDLSVNLSFGWDKVLDITLGVDYFYRQGFASGRVGSNRVFFQYNREDISYSLMMGLEFLEEVLDIIEITPVVGVTYITHSFNPVSNPNIQSRSNNRWQVTFGLDI